MHPREKVIKGKLSHYGVQQMGSSYVILVWVLPKSLFVTDCIPEFYTTINVLRAEIQSNYEILNWDFEK